MKNTRKTGGSAHAEDIQTPAPGPTQPGRQGPSGLPEFEADPPSAELETAGPIAAVVSGVIARRNERDQRTGRYTRQNTGHLTSLEHSEQLRAALEPLKRQTVERVCRQLAVDPDDGRETLIGTIDAYAEARLLRSSAFARMVQLGGFVTAKGNARALLRTWESAFDREMRAAERLGLAKRARSVNESPAEWLRRTAPAREKADDDQVEALVGAQTNQDPAS